MSKPQKNVGRVLTRQATPAHGDVGLCPSVVSLSNQEAANPTYGGMAANWKDITLGDFVALQRGHDLTEPERSPGHVPVIGSAGQNGFHDTALAKGPGIVIGRSGASFGQVHFCATDYWPHNTGLNESIVEDATLTWFGELGYAIGHGSLNPPIPYLTHVTLCNALLPRLLSGKLRKRNLGGCS